MKIKTVSTVVATNSAGQIVESLPVRSVDGPVQNSAGQWIDAIEVEESPDGVPVRFVESAVTLNSAGQPVAATPVKGGGGQWLPVGMRGGFASSSETLVDGNQYVATKHAFWNGRRAVTRLRVFYANALVNGAGESSSGLSEITVQCRVEDSAGNQFQLQCQGQDSRAIAPGELVYFEGETELDPDEKYFVRTFREAAVGAVVPRGVQVASEWGEGRVQGNNRSATLAAFTGTITSTDATVFAPWAVVGLAAVSNERTIAILGDSIADGSNENLGAGDGDAKGNRGYLTRGLAAANRHFLKLTMPGSLIAAFQGSAFVLRRQLLAYCTDIIFQAGENNVAPGFASLSAAYEAAVDELRANHPGKGIVGTQLLVRSTSTDSWATEANQTAQHSATRSSMRSFTSGLVGSKLDGVIDGYQFIRGTAGDKWIVNGAANYPTTDGLHPSAATHILARQGVAEAVAAGVFGS